MGGESFQGLGAGDGVEAVLDKDDFRQGDLGEVGALGEPKADEAVGVLDGAFLPGGVGVGVVDGSAEDAFEGGLVEELAAVIGGHGADRAEGAFGDEAAEGAVDGLLADGAQRAQEDVAGAALEQDEESAAAGAPGDDAVHLPIAKALPEKDFRGALLDGPAAGEDFAAPGVAPTARLARTIAQTALGQDDDAVFEVIVDGALRGEALPTLEAERVQAGGDGEASRKEGDETHGEEIGHHGAAAFGGVGLLGALLGQDGGILGADPAAMDFVAQQDAGDPAFSSRCSRLYERR